MRKCRSSDHISPYGTHRFDEPSSQIHTGLSTSSRIGAPQSPSSIPSTPSLTGVTPRTAACFSVVIFFLSFEPVPMQPSPSSRPGLGWSLPHLSDQTTLDFAISSLKGQALFGNGCVWCPKACSGSKRPRDRIHLPTPARETRTSCDPPTYISDWHQVKGCDDQSVRTLIILASATLIPNARKYPAAWSSACIGSGRGAHSASGFP